MKEATQTEYRLWTEKPGDFSAFRVSPIKHNFSSHPLMQLPRLAALAKNLYQTNQCRFIKPGSDQAAAFDHKSRSFDGRDIDEVFARIAEPGSWVALYNIETDPEYRDFLLSVANAGRHLIENEQPGIYNVQGFLFVSAPPSFTPFHIDRENNLWLQMHGRKVISVWDHRDRESVSAEDVENFIMNGGLGKSRLSHETRERARDFDVVAGAGVYFPATSPHATATEALGEDPEGNVSVSVGVVFYTDYTQRTANAHVANSYLRRLGFSPTFARESPLLDRFKYPLGRVLVEGLRRFRGFKPKPGILPGK